MHYAELHYQSSWIEYQFSGVNLDMLASHQVYQAVSQTEPSSIQKYDNPHSHAMLLFQDFQRWKSLELRMFHHKV